MKKASKIRTLALTSALAIFAFGTIIARADDIELPPPDADDPATLHLGPGFPTSATCSNGTSAANGCGLDPNHLPITLPAGSGRADIYQNSSGANPLTYLTIVLAVANGSSSSLNVSNFSNVNISNPLGSGYDNHTATLTALHSPTGYFGQLTSTTATSTNGAKDVYGVLGLGGVKGIDQSNSFVNLAGADQTLLNLTVSPSTGFAIFAYKVTLTNPTNSNPNLQANGYLDFNFIGLQSGSYVLGYGMDSSGKVYVNPFTEVGITMPHVVVPEPASLALFGSGLLALGGGIRRKFLKR